MRTRNKGHWLRRSKNNEHLLKSLRKMRKRGCFTKEQQPQVYAILNAALDSMQNNYTVVDISTGTVNNNFRMDLRQCRNSKLS